MQATHIRSLFRRMFSIGLGLLVLAGCERDRAASNTSPQPTPAPPALISVTGYAVNGPLAGATVRIFGVDGQQLGSVTTGDDGAYHAQVSVPPPYRIEVVGGLLEGEPYQGVLRAFCETAADCYITPFTSIIVGLMDEYGYNAGDARARLAQQLNFDYDPFVRSLIDELPVEEFDLERARTYLDGGEALDEWLDAMLAWIAQPTPGGAPPAGIRYRYAVTAVAGDGGDISPAFTDVGIHGHTLSFNLTPSTGYQVATVTGCNGGLEGLTYMTGPITESCGVNATFRLKTYTVSASAGEGGTITPAEQSVAHGQPASFKLNTASGYELDAINGCDGSLSDNIYTTAPISGDCTVSATFTLNLTAPVLSASAGDAGVTVSWAPVTGADGYDLYYAEENFDPANYNSFAGATRLPNVSSPRMVGGLSNGTQYVFSAAAKSGSAQRFSALVSATPVAACFGISADDSQVCSGNGTCPVTDTCECEAGFIGKQCNVELAFSDGSREHYFPTTTGRIHIIDGPDLPAGETYVWKFEVLGANVYWPGREGFNFGVASYPLVDSTFHELGEGTEEWAYRGRDGRTYVGGVALGFGSILRNTGDQVMLELDTVAGVLNIYTKRVGESEFTLEGNQPAFTEVFPAEGRVLRPAVSGICWQTCGIRFIE